MTHNTPLTVIPQRAARISVREILGSVPPFDERASPCRSLYIHVPFCFHKCHYCDFYSIVDTRDRQQPFVDRLIRELQSLAPWAGNQPLRSIFIGGGTPSLLRVDLWKLLLDALDRAFDLSLIHRSHAAPERDSGEFTVECNPETVTSELMDTLRAGGVTRISVGAQSFESRHLKTLERWHDPANVTRAVEIARDAGIERQSVDLIFGIPGQTEDDWRRDLDAALALGTEHLSCYSLTYEPNTAMTARLSRGEFSPMEEDSEVRMHRLAWEAVRHRGMERYEVSNFAIPGAECRHNLAYWRQESWLAAGPSASAHVAGHRWKNVARLDDYLSLDDAGFAPAIDHEPPDPRRALLERVMTALRLREGIDSNSLLADAERFSPGSADRLRRVATDELNRGRLTERDGRWSLNDEGILFADGIAVDFFEAIDRV